MIKSKTEKEFRNWKRRKGYKANLDEGFLDDDKEQSPVDSLTIANSEAEDAVDAEDLLGADSEEQEEAKQSEEKHEDSGITDKTEDSVGELKDIISNLNTTVQTLADTIAKQAAEKKEEDSADSESEDEELFSDLDLDGADGEETAEGEEETEEDSNEESGEEQSAGESGESESSESSEGEKADEESSDEEEKSEDEYAGEDEKNDQKSEAYNRNMKRGKLLNSNSGSLIGPIENGKYWKLDENILTLVQLKLRQRIEEAKRELRTKILLDSDGAI